MTCPHCGSDADGVWVDEGIGSYEYWGARGVHIDWVFVCPDCDSQLETPYNSPHEQYEDEYEPDYDDEDY